MGVKLSEEVTCVKVTFKKGQCYKAIKYNFLYNEHSYHFCSLHLLISCILFEYVYACMWIHHPYPFPHALFNHPSMMCIFYRFFRQFQRLMPRNIIKKKIKMWIETHQMFGVCVNFCAQSYQHYRCCAITTTTTAAITKILGKFLNFVVGRGRIVSRAKWIFSFHNGNYCYYYLL